MFKWFNKVFGYEKKSEAELMEAQARFDKACKDLVNTPIIKTPPPPWMPDSSKPARKPKAKAKAKAKAKVVAKKKRKVKK